MTPLKKARSDRGWTLAQVVKRLAETGEQIDTGNLSRIERGVQRPSPALAENLVAVFQGDLTEIHVLYPERYQDAAEAVQSVA